MVTLDIILTLVFSIVMLIFVAFPAMKVTDWFEDTFGIDTKWHNIIMFSLVILFSLCIGIFLKFA